MHIVISHYPGGTDSFRELVDDIMILGHTVWYDESWDGGPAWWDTVLSQIEACDCYLIDLDSQWPGLHRHHLELEYALALHKSVLSVARGVPPNPRELTETLRHLEIVRYRYDHKGAYKNLIRALARLATAESVTLDSPVQRPAPPDEPLAPVPEEMASLELVDIGSNAMTVIKTLRQVYDEAGIKLSLAEAKGKLDHVPVTLFESLSLKDAERIVEQIEQSGASVAIHPLLP